jgi:hypothetical protein
MEDILARFFENLADRVSGPMKFRLVLQPLLAVFFAFKDGIKDAREGRPPYFWALFSTPGHRREMMQNGWKSVGKIFILAVVLDAVYQLMVIRWFYPGETLAVAFILAIIPYLALRGPVNRLTLWKEKEGDHE